MRNKKLLIASVAATFGAAGSAEAGLITFNESVSDYLSGSDLASGSFNISSFLDEQTTAGNNVDILSATMRVYGFSSEISTPTTYQYLGGSSYYRPSYSYSYSCGSWWSSRTCYSYSPSYYTDTTERNQYVGDGEEDVLLIDFGDQQVTDSTSNPDQFDRTDTYYSNTSYTYINRRTNVYDRNDHGSLYAAMALSDLSLSDLSDDGILNFNARATQGHVDNVNLFLDVDFELSRIATAINSVSVSSPSPLFIVPLSLVGFAALRRRQKGREE